MNTKRFFEQLREKPYNEKKHILHVTTFIFAIILVAIWSMTLSNSFRDPDLKTQFSQSLEPFQELQANVVGGYNIVSDFGGTNSQ